jgi:hypothetical protein
MKEKTKQLSVNFPVEYSEAVFAALEKEYPELVYTTWEAEVRKPRYARRHRLLELHIPMEIEPLCVLIQSVTNNESDIVKWEVKVWSEK